MQPEELKETFDQQAAGYDKQSAKVAPIYDGLHFLLEAVFSDMPSEARVLCVGVGTGAELVVYHVCFGCYPRKARANARYLCQPCLDFAANDRCSDY